MFEGIPTSSMCWPSVNNNETVQTSNPGPEGKGEEIFHQMPELEQIKGVVMLTGIRKN